MVLCQTTLQHWDSTSGTSGGLGSMAWGRLVPAGSGVSTSSAPFTTCYNSGGMASLHQGAIHRCPRKTSPS